MGYYTIHIHRADLAEPQSVVRDVIVRAVGPLVQAAGLELNLVSLATGMSEQSRPDVSFVLIHSHRGLLPRDRGLAEQSGSIFVDSILGMRVGGPFMRSPLSCMDMRNPMRRYPSVASTNHNDRVELLWQRGEVRFAPAVGNIIVHELGHAVGGLAHDLSPLNFMFTGAVIDEVLGPSYRTRENLRRLWSQPHEFHPFQRRMVVDAMRARELRGLETSTLGEPDR